MKRELVMYLCVGGIGRLLLALLLLALIAVCVEFCREVCRVRGVVALAFTPCPQHAPEKDKR